ncbi:peptidoglycan-associated lipoprotein [Sphaerotilus hippei]|uniref:Peptidoglycan-associated lipoprotein n=1 Tax=Sphaerotilus hippei TaxID=744406 RepID=A0A318H1I8_9BURK|nr:peptidoglycan-associated lipoprotein Pal [Sphaerotilus hippei]PXW96692.1 peptidoglycan-associated lipoprotein [Sphaerotilus hippei]
MSRSYTKTTLSSAALIIAASLAACSSTPTATAPVAAAPAPVAAPAAPVAAAPVATPAAAVTALPAHLDPSNLISTARSVYFDFDQYVVKGEFNGLVERQGKYLASNPALKVRVEGNTDERGGSEYNLALGQKRSEALVKALKVYGVKDGQAEAVSYGKERPKAAGHNEAAWSQNRRADIVYPAK